MSFVLTFTKMNNTVIENASGKSENCELYLLVIVIKLTVLISTKIIKYLMKLYDIHNKRVINQHNKTSIEKMQNKAQAASKPVRSDPELGLQ